MNPSFAVSRAAAVMKKEVMHILRDPFTIGMAVGVPVLLVVFFGFAIDFNFRDIRIAVYDFDRSPQSRELVQSFASSGFFLPGISERLAAPVVEVESERSFSSLVINPGFGPKASSGAGERVQLLVDGSDNLKSGVVAGYLSGIQQAAARKLTGRSPQEPVSIAARYVYNPELNTQWFVVPGLIVVVTGLLAILMTALTVAREWENGSMELLLSTPVTPLEVIAGKIAPYIVLVLLGLGFVYWISRAVFGVPFQGSYFLFAAACFLFITTSLAQGLLISVVTRQQQKAMQFSMIAGLLPALLLSGFVFPVESMPAFFRHLTMILPARWFMTIIRAVMLKGTSFADLSGPFIALVLMNAVFVAAATKRFKKDVEP